MKSITRREALRVLGAGTAALAGAGVVPRALANGGTDTPATPPPVPPRVNDGRRIAG